MEDKVLQFLEPLLAEYPDLFLVELRITGDQRSQRVQIFVDGDEGVDIDACASISRRLGAQLEEHEIFEEKYILEVSSPGLDMPLVLMRQYEKNVGRNLKIKLADGSVLKGELVEVSGEQIKIIDNKEEAIDLAVTEIKEAKVIVSFK
ncbi:MAG: ribosome maturation factor RimP [Cyclobacteriaceae bacterium]|jgi:ribosome maturation factor RimP